MSNKIALRFVKKLESDRLIFFNKLFLIMGNIVLDINVFLFVDNFLCLLLGVLLTTTTWQLLGKPIRSFTN